MRYVPNNICVAKLPAVVVAAYLSEGVEATDLNAIEYVSFQAGGTVYVNYGHDVGDTFMVDTFKGDISNMIPLQVQRKYHDVELEAVKGVTFSNMFSHKVGEEVPTLHVHWTDVSYDILQWVPNDSGMSSWELAHRQYHAEAAAA